MTHLPYTVSIVSHGHGAMVRLLLEDIARSEPGDMRLILTCNIPEKEVWHEALGAFNHAVIRNPVRRGFGANHNGAFTAGGGAPFLVLNPDLRLPPGFRMADVVERFGALEAGVCAPQVRSSSGHVEDSARRFPSLPRLLRRHLAGRRKVEYPLRGTPLAVDWVAGMFMLFDPQAFRQVGGFDERYFLYLEDADICRRLWRAGHRVIYDPTVHVVHDAQRASRRNLRHLSWHASGLLRFLATA